MSDSLMVKPEDLIDCAAVAAQIRHAIHQYPEIGLNLTRTESVFEPTATPCLSMKTRGRLMQVNALNICMPAVTMVTSQLFWPL